MPHRASPPAMRTTSSPPSWLARRTWTLLAVARGEVLADVVGADRQLAVARGRRARPGGRRGAGRGRTGRRGRPGSVRPEKSTSSTSTTTLSSMPPAGIVGVHRRPGGLRAQVVAVHRDVEAAHGHLGALDLADQVGEPVGQVDATGRDAEQDEVVGALVVLEDLVRDAAQGPGHVTRGEDGTTGRVEGMAGWNGGVGARHDADLLPCLTGQVVKGCRNALPTLRGGSRGVAGGSRGGRADRWGSPRRRPNREKPIT